MNDEHTRSAWHADDDPTQAVYRPVAQPDAPVASSGAAAPRRRVPWLALSGIVLAGVLSFAAVTAVMRHDDSSAAPPPATVATSSSPTSSAPETFPADAVETCMKDAQEVTNEDAEHVRMRKGAETSCAFLAASRSEVLAHVATDAQATTFSVKPYSVSTKDYILLNCTREGAFAYCEGGRSAKMWVKLP